MYDSNWCLTCGLPFTPVEESYETSCIGADFTNWETIDNDELCQCADEDDND